MIIEVDQSGKIGQGGSTVLAFSDDEQGTIVVPADVESRALVQLRRQGLQGQRAVNRVFAASLALLLRDAITTADRLMIDVEHTGHEPTIKNLLLHYLHRFDVEIEPEVITFGLVGKSSAAHQLAGSVSHGQRTADRCVAFQDLWALVG